MYPAYVCEVSLKSEMPHGVNALKVILTSHCRFTRSGGGGETIPVSFMGRVRRGGKLRASRVRACMEFRHQRISCNMT